MLNAHKYTETMNLNCETELTHQGKRFEPHNASDESSAKKQWSSDRSQLCKTFHPAEGTSKSSSVSLSECQRKLYRHLPAELWLCAYSKLGHIAIINVANVSIFSRSKI